MRERKRAGVGAGRLLLAGALLLAALWGLSFSQRRRAEDKQLLAGLEALTQQARAAELALRVVHGAVPRFNFSSSSSLSLSQAPPVGLDPPSHSLTRISEDAVKQSHSFTEDDMRQERSTFGKVMCLQKGQGSIFFYHTRKCAGTTLRNYLSLVAKTWRVRFMESEGQTMHRGFLTAPGILTVTSLRNPISRIMSLYWYEHVAWYNEITHEMHKCKPLSVWVNAWADGSPWKRNFQAKNPSSVYVEVQNYFVKSLTGWTLSDGPVTAQTLEMAKHVLNQIDIVLLTEEMRLPNTTNWLEYTLKLEGKRVNKGKRVGTGYQSLFQDKANRVDRKEVQRLESLLAPDKDKVYATLKEMNQYDLELWDYAKHLVRRRFDISVEGYRWESLTKEEEDRCFVENSQKLPKELEQYIGIFRPPGHKGPV